MAICHGHGHGYYQDGKFKVIIFTGSCDYGALEREITSTLAPRAPGPRCKLDSDCHGGSLSPCDNKQNLIVVLISQMMWQLVHRDWQNLKYVLAELSKVLLNLSLCLVQKWVSGGIPMCFIDSKLLNPKFFNFNSFKINPLSKCIDTPRDSWCTSPATRRR